MSDYYYYDLYKLLRLIFIPTVLIPLVLQYLLWRLKILRSFFLENPGARKYFSAFVAFIYLFLCKFLFPIAVLHELSLFFCAIALALGMAVIFNIFRIKISLHALAFGGVFVFFLIWSYRHHQNILDLLALIVIIAGLTLASRLYLKAHSVLEIVAGLFSGMISMFIIFRFL